ncbi:trypsin-like serine protease [Acinetobacter junii]|uniref:trypsin-like serine protease n=1 Tax=Acinetobacter junii TaxID=40215 RepID=UPI00321376C7
MNKIRIYQIFGLITAVTLTSNALAVDNSSAYAKLEFTVTKPFLFFSQTSGNTCGGVLIRNDVVLTAAHCTAAVWGDNANQGYTLGGTVHYGTSFLSQVSPISFKKDEGWVEIPDVDIALIRLSEPISNTSSATIAKIPAQCTPTEARQNIGRGDVTAYLGRSSTGAALPANLYGTSFVNIRDIGTSPLARGVYYKAIASMNPGDSGGPWLSDDNTLVGINNGIAGSDKYGAVICQYSNQINDVLAKWSSADTQPPAQPPVTTPPPVITPVEPVQPPVVTPAQPPEVTPPVVVTPTPQPVEEPKPADNIFVSLLKWLASLFGL